MYLSVTVNAMKKNDLHNLTWIILKLTTICYKDLCGFELAYMK